MEVQPFLVSSPISPTCHPSSVKFLNLVPVPSGDSLVVLVVKNPPSNPGDIRDVGSIDVLGRSSGEGNGNPFQYSCLENPHRQRSLAGYSPWGCRESDMTEATQIRSVAQSCPTLCDPMNRSTPGLPIHHQLPEFTQTHIHRVSDAIQLSHPLSSPSPPAPNPSQHQSLFQ